jgi:D-glycero-D-manno-heptose 1,7-bisphosphate phosphatase
LSGAPDALVDLHTGIGCFLADDEVRGWSSFDAREREWALLDAAERRSEWEQYTGVTASDAEDYGGFAATTDGADATDDYGGFEQADVDVVPRPWTVLLDRDGVLNKDVGSPGVVREEQFELLPGVSDAVRALKEDGHACVVVTNQNARRKGLLSATTLDAVHASLRREVPVDDIFVATGLDGPALKPSPDLVNLALGDADRERVVLVGDSRTDMIAACRAGVLAVLVTSSHHGVACAAELAEAPTPAIIAGGAPGGLLREGASVAAVFPGLPQALAAIRAYVSRT